MAPATHATAVFSEDKPVQQQQQGQRQLHSHNQALSAQQQDPTPLSSAATLPEDADSDTSSFSLNSPSSDRSPSAFASSFPSPLGTGEILSDSEGDDCVNSAENALERLVRLAGGCAVLDGGLATELERRGANINDPLWSAICLLDDHAASLVREVHVDYFRAGADVGTSASYQATIQGFVARGFTVERAEELLARSVVLVAEARDQFWEEEQRRQVDNAAAADATAAPYPVDEQQEQQKDGGVLRPIRSRERPLVAASVGSYGAYLADGSEYSGNYGPDVTEDTLVAFHRRRVAVLASAGADVLAFETIPSLLEARAIVRVLEEEAVAIPSWLSFSARDGAHVSSGDRFEECAGVAEQSGRVAAVGVNCTAPRHIRSLILAARKATQKPIVVYPNSGETWDGEKKEWIETACATDDDFVAYAPQWVEAGANLLGGCCRTTPHTVAVMRSALEKQLLQQRHQQHLKQELKQKGLELNAVEVKGGLCGCVALGRRARVLAA